MSARNDASIRLTLQADAAISKANQLKQSMTGIGTEGKSTGSKIQGVTTSINSGLSSVKSSTETVSAGFKNIGSSAKTAEASTTTASKNMGIHLQATAGAANVLKANIMSVGNQATIMGQKGALAGQQMATGMNAASAGAVRANASASIMAVSVAGLSASVVQLQTSFSSLTSFELKHEKAQLKVRKLTDTLNATTVAAAQYQARYNKMVEQGITSGDQYNYIKGQSAVYNDKLVTQQADLEIGMKKAKLATEELSDANANFWSGVITSSVNIGIMSGLLITNLATMKANGIGALGLSAKMGVLTGAVRTFGGALTTILKHPVFLIATAAFLAWELALSGVVEKMLGLEDGSLSVTKNIMKMFDSLGTGITTTEAYADSVDTATISQEGLNAALDETGIAAGTAAGGLTTFKDSVNNDIKAQKQFTAEIDRSTRALDRFKKKRKINPALMAKYLGIAAGSMSGAGNLYQQGIAMGNEYYTTKSGKWTEQDQANKEARMASNMSAHKSALKAKLAIKDGIANTLREAGLGFGALKLTDGSMIKTIRGHASGRYSKDEVSRGFKGGDALQGSYLQGGREAWGELGSNVNKITSRMQSGDFESALKGLISARTAYRQELEMLIKNMLDKQAKEQEMIQAEKDRLTNLDGSKAKEYYNKVGTHEAYDVYDRINYRNYKTAMDGGATVNI
uniref:Uncharacterized protein n=1 Tax=Nitrosopumivirus cobalaminus TaxID=3158414 RepID=A0AAU7N468_9VIRU